MSLYRKNTFFFAWSTHKTYFWYFPAAWNAWSVKDPNTRRTLIYSWCWVRTVSTHLPRPHNMNNTAHTHFNQHFIPSSPEISSPNQQNMFILNCGEFTHGVSVPTLSLFEPACCYSGAMRQGRGRGGWTDAGLIRSRPVVLIRLTQWVEASNLIRSVLTENP